MESERLTAAVTGGLLPRRVAVAAGTFTLRCLVWGEPGDPTAVLVHGNGAHAHWWDAIVPALVPGWRLVVPDLRGHGESDWPPVPAYHLTDLAADLEVVLGALAPGRVVLAGHSMGGRVAAWVAARRPDRVRGLALLDSRLGGMEPAVAARWRGRAGETPARDGRRYPTRDAALAAFRFVPREPDVPPAVVADLAFHAVRERTAGEWVFRFDRAVLRGDGDGGGDLEPRLGALPCPVLVLAGERSWVMDPPEQDRLRRMMPACAVKVFPGGHHFLVAHPGPVGAALRGFLDGLPR